MAAASTAPTPMATTLDVILNSVPKDDAERAIMERVPYREVIGSLMYIACKTRPDITYAVNILARFVNGPLLRDLGVMFHTPSTIYEDNAACIKWTEVDTKSSRHISVRYHIAREAVSARKVRIEYCESSKMLADALTKALGPQKYRPLIDMYPMGDTNAGANSRHP